MGIKDIIEKGKQTSYYNDFLDIEQEINNYRNNIQPMTDEQGNNFRHIAGSARMTQKHNPFLANGLGIGKEIEDYFIKNKSGLDSLNDIQNNLYGSLVGQMVKKAEPRTLFDWIYKGLEK